MEDIELVKGRFEIYFCLYFMTKHVSYPILVEYVVSVYRAIDKNPGIRKTFNGESPKIYLTEFVPSLICIFLLAMRSDTNGKRKVMLASPLLGHTVFTLGFILDFHLNPGGFTYIYICTFISGLLGGDGSVRVAMTCYVSDYRGPTKRTRHLIIMEVFRQLSTSLASIVVPHWVFDKGFIQVLWLNFGFSVLLTKLVFHMMSESTSVDKSYSRGNFRDYIRAGSPSKLKEILKSTKYKLILLSFTSFTLLQTGFHTIFLSILENAPMCFTPINAWTSMSIVQLITVVGLLLSMFLLRKFSDYSIGLLGMCSCFLGFLSITFIRNIVALLTSNLLLIFQVLPYPTLLSVASKNIITKYRAMGLALLAIGEICSGMVTQLLYPTLIHSKFLFRNAPIQAVGLVTMVIPICTFVYYIYIEKKRSASIDTTDDQDTKSSLNLSENQSMQSNITL